MLLKNVKQHLWKIPSITARLTCFYALAGFVILGLVAVFLYYQMINILFENDRQFLADKIAIVYNLLSANEKNALFLKHEIQDTPAIITDSNYHYFIRILDSQHRVYIVTPGMEKALEGQTFLNRNGPYNQLVSQHWLDKEDQKYLLAKQTFTIKGSNDIWQIQAALNVSAQHTAILQFRNIALSVFIGGELLTILFGYFIARQGLKRLKVLVRIARTITARSLHQRITAQSWPNELQPLAEAFNDMLMRIETAFSHLTQFSADLAHELRTPINNLLGETEIALSQSISFVDYKNLLASNMEELQRIAQIIENILYLARTENPQLDLPKILLDLRTEWNLVTEFYEAMAADKNITVKITGQGQIMGNQIMLRRVFSNLLSNALKYSNANGQIECAIQTFQNGVQVRIADNGIGIAVEHLPKLFNRFYRVDSARAQHYGSVGLGLAIVKSILNLHHGTIEITSLPDQGTSVTLFMPFE